MLVEFETVKRSAREQYENEEAARINGTEATNLNNREDFKCSIVVDMASVLDFEEGVVYYNGQEMSCVYARIDTEVWTRNLLISFDSFKTLFERVNNYSIPLAKNLLM